MSSVALGELVEIKGGGTPDKKVSDYWGGSIPWASVKDFKSTSLASTIDQITQAGVANSATQVIPAGNIIVPTRMAVGKAAINEIDLAINQDLKALIPSQRIDRKYLLHALLANAKTLVDQATGATVKGIKLDALRSLKIPLPPLEEQRRIAGILDQADTLRRLRTRALDKLNTLGQAIFHDMFGDMITEVGNWRVVRLEDHVIDAQIGAVRGAKEMSDNLPVAYLRMDSIGRDGSLRLKDLKRVEASEKDKTKYALQTGDLLFNTRNTRELVGKTAVVREAFGGIYNNNILRCRFSECLSADFVDSFFRTRRGRSQLENIKSGTTSVFAIYQKAFMALQVPAPPTELQIEFSRRLARLHANRQPLTDSDAELSGLFASLQHRAFRVEL